jgi:hypothetical protein
MQLNYPHTDVFVISSEAMMSRLTVPQPVCRPKRYMRAKKSSIWTIVRDTRA